MDDHYVGIFTYFPDMITDHLWIHQRNILIVVCVAAIILLSILGVVIYYIVKHFQAIKRNKEVIRSKQRLIDEEKKVAKSINTYV